MRTRAIISHWAGIISFVLSVIFSIWAMVNAAHQFDKNVQCNVPLELFIAVEGCNVLITGITWLVICTLIPFCHKRGNGQFDSRSIVLVYTTQVLSFFLTVIGTAWVTAADVDECTHDMVYAAFSALCIQATWICVGTIGCCCLNTSPQVASTESKDNGMHIYP
jgi:hypothetical protein